MTTRRLWTRWAPLLALTALLSSCGAAVTPKPAPTPEPAATPTPEPAARQASCDDSAIRLPDRGAEVDGAIFADTLHMGGFTAPATCTEPTNESLEAGLSLPEDLTAQVRQSRYYLIVIRYPGGNRLYIVTRRGDEASCVVDLNDECIAHVTDLPDDFDIEDLPDDAPPTIPGGRPAPPTVSPPPAPSEPATPTEPAAPSAAAPRAAWFPWPSDGATNVDAYDGSVTLLWEPGHSGGRGGPAATSFDVYWGTTQSLAADTDLGTPIRTTTLTVDIQPLAFDTTYYWRVDANNAAGATRGTVWSFTTSTAGTSPAPSAGAPRAAWFPWPSDGATDVDIGSNGFVRLIWEPGHSGGRGGPPATSYDVYWGTSQNLAADADLGTPMRTTAITEYILGLASDTTYYWRVDANNAAGATRGTVWSFTTSTAPAPPTPAPAPPPAEEPPAAAPRAAWFPAPSDGATNVDAFGGSVTLLWEPGESGGRGGARTDSYDVYWGTTRNLAADADLGTPIRTPTLTVDIQPLAFGTTYYWRVDANNAAGTTPSMVWSFTTEAAP